MYEGRNAMLFHPDTGVITWMSNPAHPSFVWQLYDYDLEPNSSLFAVESASEIVHIQMNEANNTLQVINNQPHPISGATAHLSILNLDGKSALERDYPVNGPADTAINLGAIPFPEDLSAVFFVRLQLKDATGTVLSRNLYWKPNPANGEDLTPLNQLPVMHLTGTITRHDANGRVLLDVTLTNPGETMALMTHLQLRRKSSGERVLPVFYSDNYISLAPGESRTVTIDASEADLKGDTPLVVLDGWNVDVAPVTNADSALATNVDAQVSHWPADGPPMITAGLKNRTIARQRAFLVGIKFGGRGRNRTFNLSIKSRMLCQLSYASWRGDRAEAIEPARPNRNAINARISQSRFAFCGLPAALERKCQATSHKTRRLRKIQRLAIDDINRSIPLRQNILHHKFQLQPIR